MAATDAESLLNIQQATGKQVRLPKVTLILRLLFAVFLFGTGIMTMGFGFRGYPIGDPPRPVDHLMQALQETGYLIFWVGLFKFVTGTLMFAKRTTPLVIVMALPYTVNIILYCFFVAPQYLPIGVPDLLLNVFLIYAYFDWYRGVFDPS